jgi:uncharacterized repeat protein (TIGR03803 family)
MFMGHVTQSRSLILSLLLVLTLVTLGAQAQNFQVIHTFTGPDGAIPRAGVTVDRGGKLYGTTFAGHEGSGWGGVYQMRQHNSAWIFATLQIFDGQPLARVVIGPNSTLYGSSPSNLVSYHNGYLFNLSPPLNVCTTVMCNWNPTVLYGFSGGSDGATPKGAVLVFDHAGNMYGTTSAGGSGNGVVYQLTPAGVQTPIYTFRGSPDGAIPYAGVIFDSAGNLYGTTTAGGASGNGAVYKLSPNGSGYSEQVIYSFTGGNDGSNAIGGLVLDNAGNLFGTTANGGSGGGGTVFELSPNGNSYNYSLLYSFAGAANCGPWAELSFDSAGNLYGTTLCDGATGNGNIFKLTASTGFSYSSVHDFSGGNDGKRPISNVALDSAGDMFGTTQVGGADTQGVVWEITP